MGTSQFSVPILCSLMCDYFDVRLVVTQPDRPQGRHQRLMAPCCKMKAAEFSAQVVQPEKIRTPEFYHLLEDLNPDVIVTASYGRFLTDRHLCSAKLGVINVHASLLPELRGSAPINWAIIRGHSMTGISIMKTRREMDSGPIISQESIRISPEDNVEILESRLSELAAQMLPNVLIRYCSGNLVEIEQDQQLATYAPKLSSSDGMIDWSQPAESIERHIRGMTPRPGAFSIVNELRIKFMKAHVQLADLCGIDRSGIPGTIVGAIPNSAILVQTGSGLLRCELLQPPSKGRIRGDLLINGRYVRIGDRFATKPSSTHAEPTDDV